MQVRMKHLLQYPPALFLGISIKLCIGIMQQSKHLLHNLAFWMGDAQDGSCCLCMSGCFIKEVKESCNFCQGG